MICKQPLAAAPPGQMAVGGRYGCIEACDSNLKPNAQTKLLSTLVRRSGNYFITYLKCSYEYRMLGRRSWYERPVYMVPVYLGGPLEP